MWGGGKMEDGNTYVCVLPLGLKNQPAALRPRTMIRPTRRDQLFGMLALRSFVCLVELVVKWCVM